MRCQWKELLSILPGWIADMLKSEHQDQLNEIRLRLNQPPELVSGGNRCMLKGKVKQEDLNFCIHVASKYSPWSAATLAQGFLTSAGGHRIGVCGQTVCRNGLVTGFQSIQSLCIRVARDLPGIATKAVTDSSVLIIGPPGWGKTTLLRDYIRQLSLKGKHVAVVDERGELFPGSNFLDGVPADIITGCTKEQGIEITLRTMGPEVIAVDEITAEADCTALIKAGWCGVKVVATAHATSRTDLLTRPVYRPLITSGIFDKLIILQQDKSWRTERMVV